ncbi:hypothetical protein [Leptospira vanthielii]|uniref:Glycosyltransferase RgtA/B/C/D-like domain-containing protein n=1 Tax=Leptospira vanthielii TaxID=293085 RepID=A0ABY2NLV7_9LEPT|nr:hypothetical protein [Leptospira vanthielii]TGM51488.1 hypothetical protein EHQ95_14370 [Leptospira vanthielii]
MSIQSPSQFYFFWFFLVSGITNFLLCETIYFDLIHSADNLYLPLLLKDLASGHGMFHWYLPPSPYFFPDLFLNLILYPFVPFLYIPSAYGTLQMFFVLLGISFFITKYTTKTAALEFLFRFEFLLILVSFLGYWIGDNPLPFVYFLSQAHHSTGFFFSLLLTMYLYSVLNDREKDHRGDGSHQYLPNHLTAFFFFSFSLLYLSDRFSFSVGAISFFVVRIWDSKRPLSERISYFQKKRFWILSFLFILFNELAFLGLKQIFQIPGSFQILLNYLSRQTLESSLQLSGNYLWDFSKHIYYQGKSILFLMSLLFFTYPKFPKLIRHLLVVFFPVLVGLLLLVGRFTYLHPYPIRYLFPLWFFALFGITWVLVPFTKMISHWVLFLALGGVMVFLFYLPSPRAEVQSRLSSITDKEVTYDLEKPIRFWSEGKQTPVPIDKDGKPYHWITGAFHTHLTE